MTRCRKLSAWKKRKLPASRPSAKLRKRRKLKRLKNEQLQVAKAPQQQLRNLKKRRKKKRSRRRTLFLKIAKATYV